MSLTSKHGKKPCHACHAVTPHRNCSVNTIIADSLTEQVYVDGGASLKPIQCKQQGTHNSSF
ncbi:MAG: hypothetical protein PUC25_01275 [Prevotellaceae bacterium]|nr:hypothetical protein [Prevotellaceae bacterium]